MNETFFQSSAINGLTQEFDITSSDQAVRDFESSTRSRTSEHQSRSTTQQLEAKSIPPQLANTLEQIVGQLDVLTQVNIVPDIVLEFQSGEEFKNFTLVHELCPATMQPPAWTFILYHI